ncbi:RagB/SusD family nutrient uptake outer membrane protein [Flavobacterium johnsoniae]|uniref:RagB/SusD family nutrient uptake outer membrane protein n=1 Tax=Flavobacterium johnsoniae TaxID=986 RepID=A0A1J7C3C4_FLAJO|nr:RagB/SusD family nutrient uptake outer membrane protein [Flavobacterium johnsoniae]OIV40193.1 RagB/SusD family nutrient uptake outer membrane protein [Flavobacterium johnsoniae]
MKTKINIYISLAFLLIVSASCSDNFLEEKKQYNYFDDEFYQSEERVTWYVNNLYYDFFDAYKSPMATLVGSFSTTQATYTEEVGGISNTIADKSLINANYTWENAADASPYYGTPLGDAIKNEPYNRIRDCNSMLENIDTKGANLSQTFRNRVKGQMYYLRAIQYFDLMRTYGGVPIVTTVDNATNDNPATQIPRAKVSEVVAQIVSDLDLAASLLPTANEWGAAEYGRYTKGAALAQKSRVLLTYASPLFNKNWESPERWDAALKAGLEAETQLMAAGQNLYGASASDWAKMFYISDNSFNPEAITVRLLANGTTALNSNNSWEKSIRLASQGGAGGSGVKVPKSMIDLFPMASGKRPTAANNYDPFLFFKDRDPRFYRTFAFSGSYWPYTNSTPTTASQPTVWAYRWSAPAANTYGFSMGNDVPSPAFVRKMSSPTVGNASNFQYSGTDIIDYRFAELLLNIAECYAALGQTNNTIAYLGRIRNRVGIKPADNYGIGTLGTKYEAIEAVLYERRVELAYEGKRFWDIQRWMLYSNDAGTCSKLGVTPLNGTQRVGNYLHYKIGTSPVNTDPLTSSRASISVDPDAANFDAQITALAAFYTANFELRSPPTPMDNIGGQPASINWRQNYYIQGLSQAVLAQNPWLTQTVGWKDANGASGTYDYQE